MRFLIGNSFFSVDREYCEGVSQHYVDNLGISEERCPAFASDDL